jgi:hypothetical protein
MVNGERWQAASGELKNGEWRIANGREAVGAQRCCAVRGDSLRHEQIAGWSLPHLLIVPPVWEYGGAVCTEDRMGKRGVVRGLGSRTRCEQQLARSCALSVSAPKPKLLDQVRLAIRARHDSLRTDQAYVAWIKRFIFSTEFVIQPRWASRRFVSFRAT